MLKQELIYHPNLTLKRVVDNLDQLLITNALLKQYDVVEYQVKVDYKKARKEFFVDGTINFKVKATDSRTGELVGYKKNLIWKESYFFDDFFDQTIDFDQLVAAQINVNIPINFTTNHGTINKVGPGWQVLSEEEFETERQDTSDPRWDKLKEVFVNSK